MYGASQFYISVFRHIERETGLSGFVFYVAYHAPDRLPQYGDHVILLILADEAYQHFGYFQDIRCILRCMGTYPVYLDGFPANRLKAVALVHYIYKRLQRLKSLWRAFRTTKKLRLAAVRQRTLHVPLGVYSEFVPTPKQISERRLDYAFLGSVGHGRDTPLLSRLITPPKELARRRMLDAVRSLPDSIKGKIHITSDFLSSLENRSDYAEILSDAKISLCPRGTSYESYRFFESCKAGCIVVCEPLPRVWFYEKHPGIVIADWSCLAATIEKLLADPCLLAAKSAAALDYWNTIVSPRPLAFEIARFIEMQSASRQEPSARCRSREVGGSAP